MKSYHKVILVVIFFVYLFHGCDRKNDSVLRIYYYYSEKTPYQQGDLITDSVYQKEKLKIEGHILIDKSILDSLIRNQLVNYHFSIGELNVNYVDSFIKKFDNDYLDVFKFDITNIKEGYFVTILYNPDYSILIKNYHGHGRVFLDSIHSFSNKKSRKKFTVFTRKLISDTTIFPKLPEPPPLPLNSND